MKLLRGRVLEETHAKKLVKKSVRIHGLIYGASEGTLGFPVDQFLYSYLQRLLKRHRAWNQKKVFLFERKFTAL